MNYQEMSDFEINCAVAYHIGLSTVIMAENKEFNPCNSWADAGPIIQENKIAIREYDGWWVTRSYIPEYAYCQKNPLRAAMIVFLMMKGGE